MQRKHGLLQERARHLFIRVGKSTFNDTSLGRLPRPFDWVRSPPSMLLVVLPTTVIYLLVHILATTIFPRMRVWSFAFKDQVQMSQRVITI